MTGAILPERFTMTSLDGDQIMVWATHRESKRICDPFVCLHLNGKPAEFTPTQARQLAAALINLAHQADGLNP